MNYSLTSDNREFVRVKETFSVEYKFIGDEPNFPDMGKLFKGTIDSISGGGMLLKGPLSDRNWIPRFIWQKILIGVQFLLPGSDQPIAALCRVAWVEDDDKNNDKTHSDQVKFGLMFGEISNRDHDRICDFVIHSYMK